MANSREEAIETFFLDWPFAFCAGMLFGIAGKREVKAKASLFGTYAFRTGAVYLHAGFISVAVLLYVLRPDWMWMYWVDADRVPIVVVALAFALYEVCFVAGFAIGSTIGRKPAWTGACLLGAGLLAGEVSTRDRLLALTPEAVYRPFELSFSPFHITTIGWTVLVIVPLSTAALVVLVVRTARRPVP